jgi:hypothetical protein
VQKRMYADRGYVEWLKVSKGHRVEREQDVVLRRLRGRSPLLFFRRPCEVVGVSLCWRGWWGTVGRSSFFGVRNRCAINRNEVLKVTECEEVISRRR